MTVLYTVLFGFAFLCVATVAAALFLAWMKYVCCPFFDWILGGGP